MLDALLLLRALLAPQPEVHRENSPRQHSHSLLDPQFRSLAQRLALSPQPSAHQLPPLLLILPLAILEICLEKGQPTQDGSGERRAALAPAWNIAPTDAKVTVTSTRGPQAHRYIRPQYPKRAKIFSLQVPDGGLCSRTKSARTHGEALSQPVITKAEENSAYRCLLLRYCA